MNACSILQITILSFSVSGARQFQQMLPFISCMETDDFDTSKSKRSDLQLFSEYSTFV